MKEPGKTPAQKIRADTREATRRALLAAGLAETVEHGGVVPGIEAVCSRAGYSRGAFYVYFKSREDFVVQLLDWVAGDIFQAIFINGDQEAPDLRGIVGRFTETLSKREWPDVTDIRTAYLSVISGIHRSDTLRGRHAALMNGAVAQLEKALGSGQREGDVRKDLVPAHVAKIVLLVAIGLIVWDDVGIPIDATNVGVQLLALLEPLP